MKALKIFIVISVLGFVLYCGFKLAEPVIGYRLFSNYVQDVTTMRFLGPVDLQKKEILEKLLEKARIRGVPISEEDIMLNEPGPFDDGGKVTIHSVSWSVTVDLFGQYQKTYDFVIEPEY